MSRGSSKRNGSRTRKEIKVSSSKQISLRKLQDQLIAAEKDGDKMAIRILQVCIKRIREKEENTI